MRPVDKGNRRLFFALWPKPATRNELVRCKAVLASRVCTAGRRPRSVPNHNLHLTLVFLGEVPAERVGRLSDAVDSLRSPEFTLVLDRFGTFPAARVAWLGGRPPAAAVALADALNRAAQACDIGVERRAWTPHVTMFRQVRGLRDTADSEDCAVGNRPPVRWEAREFALIESIPRQPYQVLRSWPLQCGAMPDESGPEM